jgi:phosphoesterase RecJ-like protein
LAAFDLFIIQDTGDLKRVSRMGEVRIPETMKTIAIDHHDSTLPFGTSANLIDSSYPSTTAMLFDLFKLWKIEITSEIAANLFIGTYTDTGGFKYPKTSSETFAMASELARTCPQFSKLIAVMEDSRPAEEIILLGTLLGGIRTFLNGRLAIGSISEETFKEKGFDPAKGSGSFGSSMMRSVIGWDIVVSCIEIQSGVTKASFRAKDGEAFDVSKLAIALGGGGHKAAAGAVLTMPLEAAIEKIVATAKEIYNL